MGTGCGFLRRRKGRGPKRATYQSLFFGWICCCCWGYGLAFVGDLVVIR
jgi:hypothetical protein